MAAVSPARVTGTSLGRTGASDECPIRECTASEHWQPGVSLSPTSVPRNGEKLALKPMMGLRRKYVSKSFIRRKSVTFGCPEHKGVSSRRVSGRRKKLGRVVQTETEKCIDQTAGTRSTDYLRFLAEAEMKAADPDEYLDSAGAHLEDNPMSPSAKRACKSPPPVSRIPTQPDTEMGTVSLLVLIKPTWKYVQTLLVSTATVTQLKH